MRSSPTARRRELRNDSGKIMRELDKGESFIVTRNGVPVGELIPLRRQRRIINVSSAIGTLPLPGEIA